MKRSFQIRRLENILWVSWCRCRCESCLGHVKWACWTVHWNVLLVEVNQRSRRWLWELRFFVNFTGCLISKGRKAIWTHTYGTFLRLFFFSSVCDDCKHWPNVILLPDESIFGRFSVLLKFEFVSWEKFERFLNVWVKISFVQKVVRVSEIETITKIIWPVSVSVVKNR